MKFIELLGLNISMANSGALSGSVDTGAVASQIGAALETAGYHVQSQLLDIINGPFGAKIGGLLYLLGIIGALFIISSGGNYRYGLWLLIGPPIFYFLVGVREDCEQAKWQFGNKEHNPALVTEATEGTAGENAADRKVSIFFKAYNRLVSSVVQSLVSVLKLEGNGSQLTFLNKADFYLQLFNKQIDDPDTKAFVQLTLVNECAIYYASLRQYYDPAPPPSKKQKSKEIIDKYSDSTPGPDGQPKSKKYAVNLDEPQYGNIRAWLYRINAISSAEGELKLSCDELWQMAMKVVRETQGTVLLDQAMKINLPDGLTPEQRREILLQKFSQWKEFGPSSYNTFEQSGLDPATAQSVIFLNEVTARMIAHELADVNPLLVAAGLNEYPELTSRFKDGGTKYSQDTARSIRALHEGDEYLHRGELIAGALTLPYIQGMLLYFLAFAFPFFCLAMILPGRESSIFVWMGLWLWVKLWDFGFAVVMIIDNLLYSLLPHTEILNGTEGAGQILNAIARVDPTYSAHMYYQILATCLFAVPVITGMIVARSGSDLVGAVQQGWREFPTQFGNSMATYMRSLQNNQNLARAKRYTFQKQQEANAAMLFSDPVLQKEFVTLAELTAASSVGNNIISGLTAAAASNPALGNRMKELSSMLGGSADAAAKAVLDTYRAQSSERFVRRAELNSQLAAHQASTSYYVRALAAESVMLRYNSHDFRHPFPDAQALNYYLATEQDITRGRASDAIWNQLVEDTIKLTAPQRSK